MPYQKVCKGKNLIGSMAAAELLGMSIATFRYRLEQGELEQGEIVSGRRNYYSTDQIERMKTNNNKENE